MSVLVEFAYDGASEVSATLHGAVVGQRYTFACLDPNSSGFFDEEATSSPFTMTISDVGGLAAGERFGAAVVESDWGVGDDYIAVGTFQIGTPGQYDLGAVWSFDGVDTVEVSFFGTLGQGYILEIWDPVNGDSVFSFNTGTGAPLLMTNSGAVSPVAGNYFAAILRPHPGSFEMESMRLFNAGEAGAGTDGQGSEAPPSPGDPYGLGRFYEAPPWRFVVTDLDSVILTWLDGLAFDRAVTFTRGQPTTISCAVPADNPEVNIVADEGASGEGSPFVSEGSRLLFCFRREGGAVPWRIRAAGLIQQLRDNADSDASITQIAAFDPRQLLRARPLTIDDAGTLPTAELGIPYVATPGSDIIIEQLGRMEAWLSGEPLAHAGLDWGQTAFFEGTIEATEALTITFQRGVTIGEMLDELEETGTLDLVIRPIWDPENRPGMTGELSIYVSSGSPKYDAVFGYDCWPKSLVGLDRLTDGLERVNHIQFNAGQGGAPVDPYEDAASLARFGRYFSQQFFPGQVSVPAVEAMARRVLSLEAQGQRTYALSPAAERAPIPFEEYFRDDTVRVCARGAFREELDEMLRVESLPLVIDDDQLERVAGLLVSEAGAVVGS